MSSVGGGDVGSGSSAGGSAAATAEPGCTNGHHAERPHQPRTPPAPTRDFCADPAAPAPPQWANCSSGGTPSHPCAETSPEIVDLDTNFCAELTNHLGSGPIGSIEPLKRMSVWPSAMASKRHFAP